MATLCQASLLAPFPQHLLTLRLCHILVILEIFQTFSLFVMVISDQSSLMLVLWFTEVSDDGWHFLAIFSKTFRRRQWHPTPVLLHGKSHGRRSLVGWSPWGHTESDMTEWLRFHFPLSCTGDGNGNPLQCSCLENPRDGGAWWAAVYGVAQSRTRLKWLSSSSSKTFSLFY